MQDFHRQSFNRAGFPEGPSRQRRNINENRRPSRGPSAEKIGLRYKGPKQKSSRKSSAKKSLKKRSAKKS